MGKYLDNLGRATEDVVKSISQGHSLACPVLSGQEEESDSEGEGIQGGGRCGSCALAQPGKWDVASRVRRGAGRPPGWLSWGGCLLYFLS